MTEMPDTTLKGQTLDDFATDMLPDLVSWILAGKYDQDKPVSASFPLVASVARY